MSAKVSVVRTDVPYGPKGRTTLHGWSVRVTGYLADEIVHYATFESKGQAKKLAAAVRDRLRTTGELNVTMRWRWVPNATSPTPMLRRCPTAPREYVWAE